MAAVLVVTFVIVLWVAAAAFGSDSRDGKDWFSRGSVGDRTPAHTAGAPGSTPVRAQGLGLPPGQLHDHRTHHGAPPRGRSFVTFVYLTIG